MTRIGFYYDQTRCAGCKTCQVACKDKNRLGIGPVLRKVTSHQVGAYPAVKMYHVSASCNHCDAPACMAKCPTGAIAKNDDGTVVRRVRGLARGGLSARVRGGLSLSRP